MLKKHSLSSAKMNRRRNALPDIFADLSQEKIEQLQNFVNTDSRFEEESTADLIDTTTTNPTHTNSSPLNQYNNQSNPINISSRNNHNGIFYDQITANFLALRDFENSNEDSASDDEEDERFVAFINSPRYLQRRPGIVEHTFHENLNMLTGILASH